MILVVMGVSGSGKSTLAAALADQLGWPFRDADDLHSPVAVATMAAGHPLTDADRLPWLCRVADWIDTTSADGGHGVLACSALRRAYRDVLRRPQVRFILLDVPRAELARRLRNRHGHFMPATLLDSQLSTLERPGPDEDAVTVDGTAPLPAQLAALRRAAFARDVDQRGAEDSSQDTKPV